MIENSTIHELCEGNEFVGYYALRRCELRETDGSFRLQIELSDCTGRLPGVIWDDAVAYNDQLAEGDVVKVQGVVGSYRGKPQARVTRIRLARDDEYDLESFLPVTAADITALTKRLHELVASVTDPHLAKLGELTFKNETFMSEFIRSPGGMRWHHPYLGGLLEHSVSVADLCTFIAGTRPELNRDLLVMAALLHDAGKIREYTAGTTIEYTDEGRLEGHIVMGDRFVRAMCDRIDGFPGRLRSLLSHLMLSHQGHHEFSSPVEPMIPEAFVLYYADEMDSKLNALSRIMEKTREEGRTWSEYVKLLNRFIYVGDQEDNGMENDVPKETDRS